MSRDLARHIVRLYPRAWRARYEPEILALVEDNGAGVWQTIDLARGCLAAWHGALRQLGGVAGGTVRVVVFFGLALLLATLARRIALGLDLHPPFGFGLLSAFGAPLIQILVSLGSAWPRAAWTEPMPVTGFRFVDGYMRVMSSRPDEILALRLKPRLLILLFSLAFSCAVVDASRKFSAEWETLLTLGSLVSGQVLGTLMCGPQPRRRATEPTRPLGLR